MSPPPGCCRGAGVAAAGWRGGFRAGLSGDGRSETGATQREVGADGSADCQKKIARRLLLATAKEGTLNQVFRVGQATMIPRPAQVASAVQRRRWFLLDNNEKTQVDGNGLNVLKKPSCSGYIRAARNLAAVSRATAIERRSIPPGSLPASRFLLHKSKNRAWRFRDEPGQLQNGGGSQRAAKQSRVKRMKCGRAKRGTKVAEIQHWASHSRVARGRRLMR
jgi:hypothetical protein